MSKPKVKKYNVVCGKGEHRSYTACLSEIAMLTKYGNLSDYFWRQKNYQEEFVKLIKLTGKICKEVGRDRLAWFIYKHPTYNFNDDVGLLIYNIREDKSYIDFNLEKLVEVYQNKYRPVEKKQEIVKEVKKPQIEKRMTDLLGDI